MLTVVALALGVALQDPQQPATQTAAAPDSVQVVRDSLPRQRARGERRERHDHDVPDGLRARKNRTPLTSELVANAYRDAAAREIVSRARGARLEQDSSILAYDSRALQRISAGLGLRAMGRHRLMFRTESATRAWL